MAEFTHIDKKGNVCMVDVGAKEITTRRAVASGRIKMERDTLERIMGNAVKKGNVLEAARIAGIMAAKKTSDLIPMCHPLAVNFAGIEFSYNEEESAVDIVGEVRVDGRTGVEMEALTAVSVAALTIYDMCKSYDRTMTISDIRLEEKSGGKSGHFKREKMVDR